MAVTVRRTINTVSEVIFPGISASVVALKATENPIPYGYEEVSNLPLQMSLYFNAWYSPMWFTSCVATILIKHDYMSSLFKTVQITVLITSGIVEVARLYLGYSGNLCERVTELAGSWLLSILQIAVVLFLLFYDELTILPLEWACNIILLIFLLFEIPVGYFAIKKLAKQQAIRFHVQHLKSLSDNFTR
uniref:Transmembrane protein 17 n=1 Tax=Strigamia maritima TaxID=126957 RepID=T1JNW6_STRMM